MNIRTQVREFMNEAGQNTYDEPRNPPPEVTRLRVALIVEEFQELLQACYEGCDNGELANIESAVRKLLSGDTKKVPDIEQVADALADIDYVVEGARQTFGINGPAVAREVHDANMRKFGKGACRRKDGKWLKPPDWKPPNLKWAIENQNDPYCTTIPGQVFIRHHRGFELHIQDLELCGKQLDDSRHMQLLNKILDDQSAPIDWILITTSFIGIKPKGLYALRIYEV